MTMIPSLYSRDFHDLWKLFFENDLVFWEQPEKNTFPGMDIVQEKNGNYFILSLAVSGFSKADIDVRVDGQNLIVRGKKKPTLKDNEVFRKRTLQTTEFERVWRIETGVWDLENPVVTLTDGLLTIQINKNPKLVSKKITIG